MHSPDRRLRAHRWRAEARRTSVAPGSARGRRTHMKCAREGGRSRRAHPRYPDRRDFRTSRKVLVHTYTSIYLHVVFATWSRRPFLGASLRPRVHAFLASTARNLGIDDVHVGGHDDHVHLLGCFDPTMAPSTLIGRIKQSATHWLHEENVREFKWQRGFSAFSVSRDRVPIIVRYIERQEEHHRKRTFREELAILLAAHGVNIEDAHLL